MLVVFSPFFVADTKISCGYNFVASLIIHVKTTPFKYLAILYLLCVLQLLVQETPCKNCLFV